MLVLLGLVGCEERSASPVVPAPATPSLEERVDLEGFRRTYGPALEPVGVEREGASIILRARVRRGGGAYTQVRPCAPAGESCSPLGEVGLELVDGARDLRASDPIVRLSLRVGDELELIWDAPDPTRRYGWLPAETPGSYRSRRRPAPCGEVFELTELVNVEVVEWSCFEHVSPPAHRAPPLSAALTLRATAVGDARGLPPDFPALRVVAREERVRARWRVHGDRVEPPIVLRMGDTYRDWVDTSERSDPRMGIEDL